MKNLDLYRCEICGNIIQVIHSGGGELVCCGKPMHEFIPQTVESALEEKHVPVFVKYDNDKGEIRVGEVLHPMLKEHHIIFIQALSSDRKISYTRLFNIGEEPKIVLENLKQYDFAREYCNIHGLWEGKNA